MKKAHPGSCGLAFKGGPAEEWIIFNKISRILIVVKVPCERPVQKIDRLVQIHVEEYPMQVVHFININCEDSIPYVSDFYGCRGHRVKGGWLLDKG